MEEREGEKRKEEEEGEGEKRYTLWLEQRDAEIIFETNFYYSVVGIFCKVQTLSSCFNGNFEPAKIFSPHMYS